MTLIHKLQAVLSQALDKMSKPKFKAAAKSAVQPADLSDVVQSVNAAKKLTLFNRRLQKKTVKLEEASAPRDIKRYLKTMTKSTFRGDVEGFQDPSDECDGNNEKPERNVDLGKVMKKLHLLITAGKALSNEAEQSLGEIAYLRSSGDVKIDEDTYRDKLKKDFNDFLDYRNYSIAKVEASQANSGKSMRHVANLQHDDFWGTRQQLRSGKVVGDMLGGLDPVLGVLLNPTGGRIGRGDSEKLHTLLYKKDKAMSYHAAVHDAFGYLIQHHEKGPGYNYLNTRWTFFRKESPLACQAAGVKFWKKTLKRTPVEKEF